MSDLKYETLMKKYNSLLNEKDSILQAVYNDLMFGQPVKYSLRTKLIKHCNERGIEVPIQLEETK